MEMKHELAVVVLVEKISLMAKLADDAFLKARIHNDESQRYNARKWAGELVQLGQSLAVLMEDNNDAD